MKGEIWLIRVLTVIFLTVSIIVAAKTDSAVHALWIVTFGVVNTITLWVVSISLTKTSPESEKIGATAPIRTAPYNSIEFASLMVDIAQYLGKPLTYTQLVNLMLLIQAQTIYANHERVIRDDFWLIDGRFTTRGVDTTFRRYNSYIKSKIPLVPFPPNVPVRLYDIISNFDAEELSQFDQSKAVQKAKERADANGGLVTDDMMSDLWREILVGV